MNNTTDTPKNKKKGEIRQRKRPDNVEIAWILLIVSIFCVILLHFKFSSSSSLNAQTFFFIIIDQFWSSYMRNYGKKIKKKKVLYQSAIMSVIKIRQEIIGLH